MSSESVVCHWCKKPMAFGASTCSSCQKVTKEIHDLKNIYYFITVIAFILIFVGGANGAFSSGGAFQSALGVWIGLILILPSTHLWVKVSKKLGTYWWI